MLGYLSPGHDRHVPSNHYPSPPTPVVHQVWILDCKACKAFLTNRGVKAVLLLRPNVSMFSSDALPVNCSAHANRLTSEKLSVPSPSHTTFRTCECLTQTLRCHGCGTKIGYMIVIPCAQCASSITASNRPTDAHRFVFHSNEVVATERLWVIDEPGIIPWYEPAPLETEISQTARSSYVRSYEYHSRSSSPGPPSDFLPTPPLELADPSRLPSAQGPFPPHEFTSREIRTLPPQLLPHFTFSPLRDENVEEGQAANLPSDNIISRSQPSFYSAFYSTMEQKDQRRQGLQPGDRLYWHHLARSGEMPGVEDDVRARGRSSDAFIIYDNDRNQRIAFER